MSPGYVSHYTDCDCGSPTYGWEIRSWDFEKNEMTDGVRCGGCNKVTLET